MKPLNEEELEKIRDGKLIISWAMQAGKITFARLIATIDQRDERIKELERFLHSYKNLLLDVVTSRRVYLGDHNAYLPQLNAKYEDKELERVQGFLDGKEVKYD